MSNFGREGLDISADTMETMSNPGETRMNKGFAGFNAMDSVQPMPVQRLDTLPEFIGAKKAAELIGIDRRSVIRKCQSGALENARQTLIDGNESWQIPIASLPRSAQEKLGKEVRALMLERAQAIAPFPLDPDPSLTPAQYRVLMEDYDRSSGTIKKRAEAAHAALWLFHTLIEDHGYSIDAAEKQVKADHNVSKTTLWRYRQATQGQPKAYWLALLSPKFSGGRPAGEFTPAAYEYIKGRWLNTSKTPLTVLLEDARDVALQKGWVIPGYDAVNARLKNEPSWLATLGREGPKALERSYPAVKRDYTGLALHELWQSDGRRADVVCLWPDGTRERPFIIVWSEVRSRLVLSAKGYRNPTAEGVLSAFGMAMERTGTAPDFAKLDNGREYAAKSVTGGQSNRYRFKVVPGEQPGVMKHVGTKAEWSKPGRGQDKPIESFWNYLANRCDKAPEFQGAYCGRNTVSKPEDFDRKKAVPIALYAAFLADALERYNTQHRHTGSGMDGRTPLEVYTELAAHTVRQPLDPFHIRLCSQLGHAQIKPGKLDAVYSLTIPGYGDCRYYNSSIASMPEVVLSRKHNVYYELESPQKPVSIYDGTVHLGNAQLIEDIPFREIGGERAAAHVQAKNARMKPQKSALKQIKAAAQLDAPPVNTPLSLGTLPSMAVTIEDKRKASPVADPERQPFAAPSDAEWLETEARRLKVQERRDRENAQALELASAREEENRLLDEQARKVQEKKRQQWRA
jgi:hypothetical protein